MSLLTDKPDLYTPYGFAVVPQHCFRGPMPARSGAPNARLLSLDDPVDLAIVTEILASRSDVSRRFAVRDATRTFLLNACFDPDIRLSHLPGLGAVVAWKPEGNVLKLLDIVARQMPDLDEVLAALGANADIVEVLFAPDRLGWPGEAIPYRGACDLMVRFGRDIAMPAKHFILPPSMDF